MNGCWGITWEESTHWNVYFSHGTWQRSWCQTIHDRNVHSLWMWHSLHHEENPMHTPVKVVLLAAPNTRCWVNSLASLYWVRPSLLSSSLFSVLFWASDVAILSSRSMLMLCSEVVPLRAQHIMTSSQLSTLPLVDPWCRDTPAAPQVQTQAACHRARPVGHHAL